MIFMIGEQTNRSAVGQTDRGSHETNAEALEQQNSTQRVISESTTSLAGNSEGITRTLVDVAEGSDQISASGVQDSAQQLSLLADKLQRAVEQFKV